MTLLEHPSAAPPQPDAFADALAPGDEALFWQRDTMHFPGQMTALESELVTGDIAHGIALAFRRYGLPIADVRTLTAHGRVYQAMVPGAAPPAELAASGTEAQARLEPVLADLGGLWERRWLPEILDHLAAMERVDVDAIALDELVAHVDDAALRLRRLWELHMELVLPAYLAVSEFDELHRDLTGGTGFDAYRLLQGLDNKTVEVGRDLWRLSRVAQRSPDVMEVLGTSAAAEVLPRLAMTADGRALLADLDVHLARYGHRGALWGLSEPTFREDPTPVVKMLQDYVTQPDAASPDRELERLGRERDEAIAQARAALDGYPGPVVAQFEAMLEAAQVGLVLTEDHGFHIDFHGVALVRRAVLALGRRLVEESVLAAHDDVLHLTLEELRATAQAAPLVDRRALVAARKGELERHADVPAPPVLGTPPAGPPPADPMTRAMLKFFGTPPAEAPAPGVVQGSAGSAGRVRGVARVVRSLQDAERLAPGEVLVAETTAPPWTPLFAVAAAVVTDTGGILSHAAVVAREYGLPAVVGAAGATAVLRDGDVVEVDGDRGTVRVVG
jgi:phosphohistidine swiveling domain-containing protein